MRVKVPTIADLLPTSFRVSLCTHTLVFGVWSDYIYVNVINIVTCYIQ